MFERLVKGAEGVFFTEVAEKAHDQAGTDAEFAFAVAQGSADAVEHAFERNSAFGMALGIEKNFRVHHSVGMCAFQIGMSEIVEVLLAKQYVHALIVDVEKGLQVLEFVGGANFFHRIEGKIHAVSAGDSEHQIRFETAFDMHVQFGLGQGANEIVSWVHSSTYFQHRMAVNRMIRIGLFGCYSVGPIEFAVNHPGERV